MNRFPVARMMGVLAVAFAVWATEARAAELALRDWERVYNEVRFSMALNGRTPAEKLATVLAAA
jgi:transposase InsO family protein